MNLLLATIGTWKRSPEKALFEHYLNRLPWKLTMRELEAKGRFSESERPARETEILLDAVRVFGAARSIALDPAGNAISSETFAATLGKWKDAGDQKIALLIGGDQGLDQALMRKCDARISFGAVTWPHLLMRALVAEQLYRAHTILTGHPYHRG